MGPHADTRARSRPGNARTPAAFALAGLLVLAGCDGRQSVASGGAAALARNLALARTVEIHVEEESAAEGLRRLAALERARSGRDVRVLVQSPGDRDAARIVVGTPRSGVTASLAARAGIAIGPGGTASFRVGDLDHDAPEDAARATFEDPDRPGLPITVWIGNDLARLVPQIEAAVPSAVPCFATWRGGDPALAGRLWPAGGPAPRDVERVGIARLALRGPVTLVPGGGCTLEVAAGIDAATSARVAREVEAARDRASAWCGAPLPPVAVRLLAAVEDLRLGGEDARLGRWNRARPAAEMLVLAGVTDGGAAAARAGLRAALGPAVVPWIEEGASVSAARSWWGRELDRWLARVVRSVSVPHVADLLDPRADARISAHLLAPARAALFDHLRAERGDGFVRALWSGTRALDVDAELEASFAAALRARTDPLREEVARRGEQRRAEVLQAPPAAGVAFAESDPDPRRGFGSRRSQAVLAALRERGVGTIALDAAFSEARVGEGWHAPRVLAPDPGDVAIFATALVARIGGLRVALYPDVRASDAGNSTGAWSRNHEDEWAAFFERQARAVEHTGLLASLCGVDWLGVGTGLRAVSSAEPDGRRSQPGERLWKRDGWRRVVGAARAAFPGGLTYRAADFLEARRVGFWGDLDAIGCALDPRVEPGSAQPRLDIEQKIRSNLDALAEIARTHGLPVLLADVSFAPVLDARALESSDWTAVQVGILSEAIRSAADEDRIEVRGAWLARVGTDPADRGVNGHDPVLRAESDPALAPFFAGAAGWIRAGSRAGGRSPR